MPLVGEAGHSTFGILGVYLVYVRLHCLYMYIICVRKCICTHVRLSACAGTCGGLGFAHTCVLFVSHRKVYICTCAMTRRSCLGQQGGCRSKMLNHRWRVMINISCMGPNDGSWHLCAMKLEAREIHVRDSPRWWHIDIYWPLFRMRLRATRTPISTVAPCHTSHNCHYHNSAVLCRSNFGCLILFTKNTHL